MRYEFNIFAWKQEMWTSNDTFSLYPIVNVSTWIFEENWAKICRLEGCDYSVSTDQMTAWLFYYGALLSPIEENCFVDDKIEQFQKRQGKTILTFIKQTNIKIFF